MIIGTIIGLIFFIAVGYFAYNFSQCIGTFTRLNKIIHTKVFGLWLLLYVYLVYTNQEHW
ncbi:MAG: hypothetical protein CM15mP69_4970 [Ectothiorhodospiraceae bacterium]|nr:MAG: hypothetical protein CM15mP69_4970 [Ectothiorhodospiraceae bacterium]